MKAGEIVEERPIATESVHNGTLLIRIEVGVVAVDGSHDCFPMGPKLKMIARPGG